MHTFGADAHLVLGVVLQETLDTTAWELEVSFLLACDPTIERKDSQSWM